jgi:cytoskeletal protein CcmA (bactofilin family)
MSDARASKTREAGDCVMTRREGVKSIASSLSQLRTLGSDPCKPGHTLADLVCGRDLTYPGGVRTMSNPYDNASDRVSVLGPTLQFKGELHADEELLIKGRIEGSITHSQRITVCPEGTVTANVRAQMIVVEGTVTGDLQAEKSVMVRETAHLRGNITAPSVSIVEGAQFNGGIDMEKKVAAVESPGTERSLKASGGGR